MAEPASAVHRKQRRFVALMNEERAERGLPRLSISDDLRIYAKSHSREMVSNQDLYHSSNLRSLTNWDMLGENVGRGGSVRALHTAFMNSPGHRDNILRSNFRQVGVGVVMSGDTIYVTVVFRDPTVEASAATAPVETKYTLRRAAAVVAHPERNGYWIVRRNGGVRAFGRATNYGGARRVNHTPIADAIAKPSGRGYWLVSETGGVYAYGRSKFYGSTSNIAGEVVAAMPHRRGRGYYLVTDQGGVYAFGRARFRGAATRIDHAGIVDAVMHPSGRGYYLLDREGGVYTFGNIPFRGSAAGLSTAGAPTAIVADPATNGYAVASRAGGLYAFGPAGFFGSVINYDRSPVVDATYTASGKGQWLVTRSGRIVTAGAAKNLGSW